uniref:Uncharacterized protein n=1 Tax=Panagrolaimus superbus TaxID=310955 RepID=A0A914Y4P7_9BILA
MAVKLFDKMLADNPKTNGFVRFLTDDDLKLIRCLINPPAMFDSNKKWNLPISQDKAYIFNIVNNIRNGLDVDKLDYIYRDGLRCGMNKYAINMNIVKRIIKSGVVGKEHREEGTFCCLKYPQSNAGEIKAVFKSKIELFQNVYHDKKVLANDEMFKKALKLAGPHLKFRTKAGLQISLEKCHEDLNAYIQLTDDLLYEKVINA